ncbi:MAG: alpha-rhamnosidase, partial [Sphingobacteriales bacterium]
MTNIRFSVAVAIFWSYKPYSLFLRLRKKLPEPAAFLSKKQSGKQIQPIRLPQSASFPAKKTTVTIPANTTATLLLDQTVLTNAYVTLNFSMGKGAAISLRYAESLYDNVKLHGTRKGNRDAVEGKDFVGRKDSLISNGGPDQTYTSLNYRTYRYIKLVVQTKNDALVIDDLYGTFTGYPFRQNAVLNTDNAEIKTLREIGWRTARLNAVETYMDCPYYEQLQYIGDTRIQTMISYYESGDDRLARNALNLMDESRIPE